MATKSKDNKVTLSKGNQGKEVFLKLLHQAKPYLIIVSIVLTLTTIVVVLIGIFTQAEHVTKDAQINDYVLRAKTAQQESKYVSAMDLLQKALNLDPGNKDILKLEADNAFLNGDYRLAQTMYSQSGINENAQILFYLALKQLSSLEFDNSKNSLSKAKTYIENDPTSVLTLEQTSALEKEINKISQIKNDAQKRATVAKVLIENNALTQAQQILTALVKELPGYRDAHYLLGFAYLKSGRNDLARQELEKALEIDPNYKPALDLEKRMNATNN